jgi:DNA-binding MarR family transcriptional regulator
MVTSHKRQPVGEALQFMQSMWALVHALDVRSKRMAQTIGVTSLQRLVIRMIGQAPHQMASEISAILNIHPSTLTGVLARLEGRGLIVRELDPSDRRRARFKLTAAGKRIDREQRGTVEAAVKRVLAQADRKSVAQTRDIFQLLVEQLERPD